MSFQNIEKKYYIGPAREGSWSSVYTYKPRNENIFLEKGEIFAVISLQGPLGFNASTAGSLLLDHFHETYFEGQESSPLLCLEKAFVSTVRKLGEIVDNDQNIANTGIDLEIAAISIVDKIAYFVNMGSGGIYLFRGGNLINVNNALKDPTGDGYIKSASTVAQKDDVFMLMTSQGVESFNKDELVEAASDFDELILKNKPVESDTKLSLILLGVEVEKKEKHQEEEVMVERSLFNRFVKPTPNDDDAKIKVNDVEEGIEEEDHKLKDKIDEDDMYLEEYDDEDEGEPGESPIDKIKGIFSNVGTKIKDLNIDGKVKERWQNLKPEDSEETTFNYIFGNVKTAVSNFALNAKEFIWKFLDLDQGIYLKNARRGTNYKLIGVLVVFSVILLFILINTISANADRSRKERDVRNAITEAESEITKLDPQITSILGVSDVYNRDRDSYATKLNDIKTSLDKVLPYEIETDKINTQLNRLNDLRNKLDRKIVLKDAEVVFDFASKIDEGATPSDMVLLNNTILVTDSNRGKIYSVDYNGNNFKEVVKDLRNPAGIEINGEGEVFGVDTEASSPIFLINLNNGSIKRYTGLRGDGLGTIKQLGTYNLNGTNRIYFLKSTGAPVQYISEVGDSYAGAFDRFVDPAYSSAPDFQIEDGKLYFLLPGEGLARYLGDQRETYSVYGLTTAEQQNLASASAFQIAADIIGYGSSITNSLIFTTKARAEDPSAADYIAEIKIDNNGGYLSNIKEIRIDSSTKDIFVLDGTRILRFDLNQLDKFKY